MNPSTSRERRLCLGMMVRSFLFTCVHATVDDHVYGALPAERFRGLKLNKVVHTWHAHKTGFIFVVTPRAYVMHVPHPKGRTWLETRRRGHYKKMLRMFNQTFGEIEEDLYSP